MQGASTSTRSNDPAGHGGAVPSATVTVLDARGAGEGTADQVGAVGLELVRDEPGAALSREGREQGGLAARTGAQVEPALVGPVERAPTRGRARPAGSPRPARRPAPRRPPARRPGSPPDGHDAVRREGGRLARAARRGRAARAGDQGDGRRRRCRRRAGRRSRRPPTASVERVDDPLRVGVPGRPVGVDPGEPGSRSWADTLAQHGVGEAGRARPDLGADQVDAGADRRVRRDPHPEQLVTAEPQDVEDLGRGVRQRPVGAGGQDRVVGALPPDRARRQLGRERRVAPGEPVLARGGGAAPGWCRRPSTRTAFSTSNAARRAGSGAGSQLDRPGTSWPATSAPPPATRR